MYEITPDDKSTVHVRETYGTFSRQERKSRRSGQTQPRNMETNPKP